VAFTARYCLLYLCAAQLFSPFNFKTVVQSKMIKFYVHVVVQFKP